MKSEGVKDIVKWLDKRCKELKKEVDDRSVFGDDYFQDQARARFQECLSIKISTEKYMKLLRHQGE